MSPAENHSNSIPYFCVTARVVHIVPMETEELCSHCYALPFIFRWTHNHPERTVGEILASVGALFQKRSLNLPAFVLHRFQDLSGSQ